MNLNRLRSIRRRRDRYTRRKRIGFQWSFTTINWENQKWLSKGTARSIKITTPFCSSTARLSVWSVFIVPSSSSATFANRANPPLRLNPYPLPPPRCRIRVYLRWRKAVQSPHMLIWVKTHFKLCRWVFMFFTLNLRSKQCEYNTMYNVFTCTGFCIGWSGTNWYWRAREFRFL